MQSLHFQKLIKDNNMRNLLYTVLILIVFVVSLSAQNKSKYAILTIEKKSSSKLHKNQVDYWIVDIESWKNSDKKAVSPLYISGFSATDYNECCTNENLILFNVTVKESFDYKEGLLESQSKLKEIIANYRKKIQTVKKKWTIGKTERIKVYLTPIVGSFCFCKLTHKDDDSKIGYQGQAAIPVSNFIYDDSFWKSELSEGIQKYDYSSLPFLSLHTMQ